MSRINIGIDTGGTYTDAVIVDIQARQVLASAKAVTTHGDLSLGVSAALSRVLEQTSGSFDRGDVSLVSVSTTLATNALVEGRGSPVAAVLIGFDDPMAARSRIAEEIPPERIIRIDGGHDFAGSEKAPLDEAGLRAALGGLSGKVEAIAIASLYSVRNAAHEHLAQSIVQEMTGLPVSLSSELSSELDVPRRALTATLNARIISRIVALVAAIRRSLARHEIDARLMVVKGDGSLASADIVVDRPIETIMSGPAASVIGARYLAREKDFIISDIGGTTTDIATAHDGWPDVSIEGSRIGDYRTMVHAVDMQTEGLGGDSEVLTDYKGGVFLGRNRVVPLSLIGARWSHIGEHIQDALQSGRGLRSACRFLLLPEGLGVDRLPADLERGDREFLQRIGSDAKPWFEIAERKADEERVRRLGQRGLVQVAGLTPTDAAHVLGQQDQWCVDTARLGCQALGRVSGLVSGGEHCDERELRALAAAVFEAVVRRSAFLLLQHLAHCRFAENDPLIAAVASGDGRLANLDVSLSPGLPLIAVGGPAALYYPEVGRRLGARVVIPAHAEIANAVGAAVGMVRTRQSIEVTGDKPGRFLVHGDEEPTVVKSAIDAMAMARELATERARQAALEMGAVDPQVEVDIDCVELPHSENYDGLVSATVTAVCTGRLD